MKHWLYGCRKAGQAWEDHYADVLFQAGFERGTASPVSFWHEKRSTWCIVHGDDFTCTGYDEDLDFIESIMQDAHEIKVRGRLGPGPSDVRSIDILGRVLEYESWGVSWKADPRHRKMIIDHFGFNDKTKAVTVTGIKEEPSEGGRFC